MRKKKKKPLSKKIVLRLPDLDFAKKLSARRPHFTKFSGGTYRLAMEQLVASYCSEPSVALNRAAALRFRLHLEALGLRWQITSIRN